MKQKKFYSNGETLYEVTFISGENEYLNDEKPTTHKAKVFSSTGYWFICISIDEKPANSVCYRSPKSAVKHAWIVE